MIIICITISSIYLPLHNVAMLQHSICFQTFKNLTLSITVLPVPQELVRVCNLRVVIPNLKVTTFVHGILIK